MPMAAQILPPPLRDGDRLTADEFMRRWEAVPDSRHAELIDGIVLVHVLRYRYAKDRLDGAGGD